MKRWAAIATAGFSVILLILFSGVWMHSGRSGSAELENWIGRQIVAVLQGYIGPRITFRDVHYQPPRTVLISGFLLTAGEQPILSVDRALLRLAEIPQRGRPIQVQRVELEQPKLLLMSRAEGGLLGWSDFLRRGAQGRPESLPAGRRLSDILVLRHVDIHGGEITYADAQAGSEPMTLPGIELVLDTLPEAGEPGWYRLIGTLQRAPLFRAHLNGRLNLNSALLELARLELALKLDEDQYSTLPPRLQSLLRAHQVRGALAVEADGQVPLRDPRRAQVKARARLENAQLAHGGALIPVGALEVNGEFPGGPVHVSASRLALHAGGQVIASIEGLAARLRGLPNAGEPLHIDRLDIQSPELVFRRDARGGFAGWRQLHTQETPPGPRLAADTTVDARPAAKVVQAVAERVSLDALQVHDAAVCYETPAGQEFALDGIEAALQSSRAPQSPDVWCIQGTLGRAPFLTGELAARLDPHTMELSLDRFALSAALTEAAYQSLPAQTRANLPAARLLGELAATGSARVPLRAPAGAAGQVQLALDRGRVTYHNTEWTLPHLTAAGEWPGGPFSVAADDIEMHSGADSVLSIAHLAAEMPHLPAPGRPAEISRLVLQAPRVALKQAAGGGLVGWNVFLHGADRGLSTSPASAPAQEAEAHWLVHRFEAHDGELRLSVLDSPRQMVISGLELEAESGSRPGWYSFNGAVEHAPDLNLTFSGAVSPATSVVQLSTLELQALLGERQYACWPPAVQTVLRRYQVRGALQAQAAGCFSWRALNQAHLRATLRVEDGEAVLGKATWPVQKLQIQSELAGDQIAADYTGQLLGGELHGHAGLTLSPPGAFSAVWEVAGLDLQQMLRAADAGAPQYAGRVASTGRLAGQMKSLPASLSGDGTLQITQGRLIQLPVIRDLLAIVTRTQLGSRLTRLDRAETAFSFRPDHVLVSHGEVTTPLAVLHGRGRIYYDKRLDLEIRIKPFHELQRLTGRIGEALGTLASRAVTYRVRGTLDQPQIQAAPLGL